MSDFMQNLTLEPEINIYYLSQEKNNNNYISEINLFNTTSYCVIKVLNNNMIQLSYYLVLSIRDRYIKNSFIPIIFTANNAKSICDLIRYHQNIFITFSSDHALYLGRELMKAEFALIISQQYIQA